MDEQLVIDSSGAWVRKTAQLIAEKPFLPPEHFGGLHDAIDNPRHDTNDKNERVTKMRMLKVVTCFWGYKAGLAQKALLVTR